MSFFKPKKTVIKLPPLPPAPAPIKAKETAAEEVKKKRRRLSQTILTSPQGIMEPATVERKTLLGG